MELKDVQAAGIHYVELAWRNEEFDLTNPGNLQRCSAIVDQVNELGLEVWSIHLPYGPEWDVSNTDVESREAAVARHSQLLRHASKWNIHTAVLHPSWEPISSAERKERLYSCKQGLSKLAEVAAELDIRLAVECLPRTCLGNTSAEILQLLEADERLVVCCDVNHLLQEAPENFIRQVGSRIHTVHMSDHDGVDERHFYPGEGRISWNHVIAALAEIGYQGPFLFEVRPVDAYRLSACWKQLLQAFKDEQSSRHEHERCIAVTDQQAKQIIILDPEAENWADSANVWTWAPEGDKGFETLLSAWGLPTDAKLRWNSVSGSHSMIVSDSAGLAAIVAYPQGDKQWGLNVGGNPHSVELLPDGNLAVAASHGNWVRVYLSSLGADAVDYAEFPLAGAHGVQWDPQHELLWAVGDDDLVALEIAGTSEKPIIREARRTTLPTSSGHDLQPVYGNPDRLWVSTGRHVYQYIKSKNEFDETYADHEFISRANVKSVGNMPSGLVVTTVPDQLVRAETGCSFNDWCTDTVDLSPAKRKAVLPGSAIYKARVWCAGYN
ncbi:hypothetical protein J14TS5_41930 [Paenibacillus lautus]|uniref:DUF6528 family protein n=1 Tax=Paenibacillus lautus TaxID=1401 RepID=UPI001B29D14C|nr:DUF6528 family protein [Paenibacillus lautus]GIO99107.1 hypothetical protein J14TS5_41930 [Paenibacillus lautus]